jgi:uncharacterized damage-inducible protein DinB
MIDPAYVRTMARYNAWQNANLTMAAGTLDEAARAADRGAFFGSIQGTLNHLLWADRTWLHRFAGAPKARAGSIPDSVREAPDWETYLAERRELDAAIQAWAEAITTERLAGDLTWTSSSAKKQFSRPMGLLVVHFFNHQTHHRGQVHAMLTAAGAKPDATDLPYMP